MANIQQLINYTIWSETSSWNVKTRLKRCQVNNPDGKSDANLLKHDKNDKFEDLLIRQNKAEKASKNAPKLNLKSNKALKKLNAQKKT